MYDKEQITKIIKEKKFSTKLCHSWKDSCLILVPNFNEYNFLFGNGITRTCYAHNKKYWDEYHEGDTREIDFLSVSNNVIEQYQYITFCLSIEDINWGYYNIGGLGNISGRITVHDFNHWCYFFNFSACFHKYKGEPYIDENRISIYLNVNISKKCLPSHMKFVDFCGDFGERGLMPTVVKISCIDMLKDKKHDKLR